MGVEGVGLGCRKVGAIVSACRLFAAWRAESRGPRKASKEGDEATEVRAGYRGGKTGEVGKLRGWRWGGDCRTDGFSREGMWRRRRTRGVAARGVVGRAGDEEVVR